MSSLPTYPPHTYPHIVKAYDQLVCEFCVHDMAVSISDYRFICLNPLMCTIAVFCVLFPSIEKKDDEGSDEFHTCVITSLLFLTEQRTCEMLIVLLMSFLFLMFSLDKDMKLSLCNVLACTIDTYP